MEGQVSQAVFALPVTSMSPGPSRLLNVMCAAGSLRLSDLTALQYKVKMDLRDNILALRDVLLERSIQLVEEMKVCATASQCSLESATIPLAGQTR